MKFWEKVSEVRSDKKTIPRPNIRSGVLLCSEFYTLCQKLVGKQSHSALSFPTKHIQKSYHRHTAHLFIELYIALFELLPHSVKFLFARLIVALRGKEIGRNHNIAQLMIALLSKPFALALNFVVGVRAEHYTHNAYLL